MTRVLITGASGFVGRAVTGRLFRAGFELTLASRSPSPLVESVHRHVSVGDVSGATDWTDALSGCDVVVHLAGQVPGKGVGDERMRSVNDEGTANLTKQAAAAGLRQFVFVSSIAAVGGHARQDVVTDATPATPSSAYGRSKLAAEGHVAGFAGPGRSAVSLRPVIVYGGAAPGNWRLIQRLAASGLPLPFGAVRNQRSMISASNVADAILAVVSKEHDVPSGSFVIADTDPIGLGDIVRILREGMGMSPRLVGVPPALLALGMKALGRGSMANSLLDNLVVDSSRFSTLFQWSPQEDIRSGIRQSGRDYRAARLRPDQN